MRQFLKRKKNINLLLGVFLFLIFAQSIIIAKLFSERDDKNYVVNLVKINTKKDSIDYFKMKTDLGQIDQTVRDLHQFLASKNIEDSRINYLAKDSLNNAIYLSKQSNRYSQYLVNLQNKLQTIPLGIPTDGYISSNFGKRINPIPNRTVILASVNKSVAKDSLGKTPTQANAAPEADQIQFHKGLDIAVAYGTPVRCAAAGKVIFAGQKGGYGNCIIVSHGNGLDTLYGHLSELLVKSNDVVKVNDVIAKSGNTGRSTGPHLHYEVRKNNTPVNPRLFLNL
ncbi:Peptidase family M23 [Halpernia humi]|uniref:Peptidase family M23 n=1 Tax=Halpernia humi TaxID=493375 RepID=A0A1H6B4A0_9FLAO|nr:M23 family metallopeptidase [Halpernia humi]SEG54966.1 Peptidase family M23 [Halpernia humi]